MTNTQYEQAQKIKQENFIKENNLVEISPMDLRVQEGIYYYFRPCWDQPGRARILKMDPEHHETWGRITNMNVRFVGEEGMFPEHISKCIEDGIRFFK